MNPPPDIRDIAPPVDVFPYPIWLVVTICIFVVIVLALAAWFIVRAMRRKKTPPPLPHAVALAALERARTKLDTLDSHAFSILVSDILRDYLLEKFGLPATRQTSEEFLRTLENFVKFSDDEKSLLARFLEKCDLIKFAHIDASRADSESLLDQAIHFVKQSANISTESTIAEVTK
jgi:Domain of unknown function (DUF4381)